MKFTYLGTAAAEGFPAVFCNCKYCNQARQLGGKNIRTRSQSLVNDDLLIDLPADTYLHFLSNNIRGDRIKHLLITHSHSDHLYPAELLMRHDPYSHNMEIDSLNVYCSQGAYDSIFKNITDFTGINVKLIKPFETRSLDNYEITALPARHKFGDDALIYIIKGEKTILYAHDTGYLYDEVFEYIKQHKIYFDFISLDCTNVDISISDDGPHMGIANIMRVVEKLSSIGAIDKDTIKYINHFSHNANPIHSVLEKRVADLGYHVSYDGLTIEL